MKVDFDFERYYFTLKPLENGNVEIVKFKAVRIESGWLYSVTEKFPAEEVQTEVDGLFPSIKELLNKTANSQSKLAVKS